MTPMRHGHQCDGRQLPPMPAAPRAGPHQCAVHGTTPRIRRSVFPKQRPNRPLQGHQWQLDGEFRPGPSIINTNLANSTGANVAYPGAGHNAWLLTSTALVLFMTLPGLALFYGGMVRRKNVLSVLAQCFLITGLVTILWVFVGYGMIFGGTGAAGQGRRHYRLGGQSDDLLDDEKRHLRAQPELFLLGFGKRGCDVPVDVRHHHPGADHRFHRRTHEVQGHLRVHDLVDVHRLFHPGPRGLGHQRL